jgi:hypothetical protein
MGVGNWKPLDLEGHSQVCGIPRTPHFILLSSIQALLFLFFTVDFTTFFLLSSIQVSPFLLQIPLSRG